MRELKVNDVVKYRNDKELYTITELDKVARFNSESKTMYEIETICDNWCFKYADEKDLQFISTYKDYLKDKIIKELNELDCGDWNLIGNSNFAKFYYHSKSITFTNEGIIANHNIPLSLLKQIIEFFELEAE